MLRVSILYYIVGFFALILFGMVTMFDRGLSEYLHEFNEQIRQRIFDDKIYSKSGAPLLSTFGMLRFMQLDDDQLDTALLNLKYNLKSYFWGAGIYFVLMCAVIFVYGGKR